MIVANAPRTARERGRKYDAANRIKRASQARARQKINYFTPTGRLRHAASVAKARAKQKGALFALDEPWLLGAAQITHCAITGLPFSFSRDHGLSRNPLGPSIDRIDSTKGYTPDNVRVISTWANVAKSDLPEALFRDLIFSVVAHSFGANTQAIHGSRTVH